MVEVPLEGLPKHIEEATVKVWYVEEGDPVEEGDDLVELSTEEGSFSIHAASSGILAEVYYDEGEVVAKGELLCCIDDEIDGNEDEEAEEE